VDLSNLSDAELVKLYQEAQGQSSAPVARQPNAAAMNPEASMPFGLPSVSSEMGGNLAFNPAAAIIKAGSWLDNINKGVTQAQLAPGEWLRKQLGMPPTGLGQAIDQSQDAAKQPMADLAAVHPGSTLIGDMAASATMPWRALPIIAASEYGTPAERALRGGAAVLGNKVAQYMGGIASRQVDASAAKTAENAAKNAELKQFTDSGYVVPPSQANPTATNQLLTGLAGGTKTEQGAARANASVTDKLAWSDLPSYAGRATGDTAKVISDLQKFRANQYQTGYKPLIDIPQIIPDTTFAKAVPSLIPSSSGGAVKAAGEADIADLAKSLSNQPQWTGAQLVKDIQTLRFESGPRMRSADPGQRNLGQAQRQAADMLEKLADRNAPGIVEPLRAARQQIAASHTLEDALTPNGINAAKLDVPPGGSPGMALAQAFAEKFPKSAQVINSETKANPVSVVDALMSLGPAVMSGSAAAMTHGPAIGGLIGGATAMAPIVGRPALRSMLLSQPYQKFMTLRPEQVKGLLGQKFLNSPVAPWGSGLLGYEAANR